jgi:hypothetical protein
LLQLTWLNVIECRFFYPRITVTKRLQDRPVIEDNDTLIGKKTL